MRAIWLLWFGIVALLAAGPVRADDRCLGPVARRALPVVPAAFRLAQSDPVTRVTFIGHSTFLLESPGGISIATDYNDYVKPDAIPVVATMNRAHSTHFSVAPDPAIQHVLRGWSDQGGSARHDINVGDVRVRNVPTNIRDMAGGTDYYGNSIFVFHSGGLCIAHLGHLHHTLSPQHLRDLGPIDIVLVPVDGSWTLNIDGMVQVLKQINAPVMIPMHYFGDFSLNRFIERVSADFAVVRQPSVTYLATRAQMPDKPTLMVLEQTR